jgi:apolipoprotein N-acyltransferase
MIDAPPVPAWWAARAGRGTAVPLHAAAPAAVAAGLAVLLAFPPFDLWFLAPVGVALLAAAVHRRRPWAGAALGLVTGLVLFVPLLSWTNLHTGYLPWLLLSASQAAMVALLGAAAAYTSPLVDRYRVAWPAVTGLLWVAQEALRDRAPFGGFPWGRLAFSQGDAPALRLAIAGGAPLVTLAVGLAGGLLLAAVWRPWRLGARRRVDAAGYAVAAGLLLGLPALLPVRSAGASPVTVAIVQGNVPRLGLDFNEQRRAVLDNHVLATRELADQVATGARPRPQLVVWPENSSDIDPLRNADAAQQISVAADAIGAPILVGAVLRGPGPGQVRNAGLVWRPGTGPDLAQLYVKRHPVPFAEYVPLRPVARLISSEVDRVRSDFVAGRGPGVLQVGPAVLGDVICFEVAYDEIVRDTVVGGAQVLVVQTNNATFNVAEARQQLAMVRLRAVEHGREALMASTVGVSAFVGTGGQVRSATGFNTAAVVVAPMQVGGVRTLATRLGLWPEVAAVALAVLALAGAARLRHGRARRAGTVGETKSEER